MIAEPVNRDSEAAHDDRARLRECEALITSALRGFLDIGSALSEVQQAKLYSAAGFSTFETYCKQRWGISRQQAYRLIAAATACHHLGTARPDLPLPPSEAVARELAKCESQPEIMVAAWDDVVRANNEGIPITAQATAQAIVRACEAQHSPAPAAQHKPKRHDVPAVGTFVKRIIRELTESGRRQIIESRQYSGDAARATLQRDVENAIKKLQALHRELTPNTPAKPEEAAQATALQPP